MGQLSRMFSARASVFAAAFFGLLVGRVAANDIRFSTSLEPAERAASGLTKLNSDEVAVIDALVRRDTGSRKTPMAAPANSMDSKTSGTESGQSTFSRRLSADERKPAGIAALSATEVAHLDAFVERHQNAKLARTLLSPPSFITRSRINPTETKKEREIHGSFSLSYGWGSGGYSEKTGSMMLSLEDPQKGYSITFGYTESHIKGGPHIYRDPLYYDGLNRDSVHRDSVTRDPFADAHREFSVGIARP